MLQEDELASAASECEIGVAKGDEKPEEESGQAAAAVPAPVIGLGKWVAGLVAGHIQGVVTRRLGMDEEYNRFLALSVQLRAIESQLKALDERFDRLGEQIKAMEFRQISSKLARDFVDPVQNGTHKLEVLACTEAAVINPARMGLDAKGAAAAHEMALEDFEQTCRNESFENIPRDLTAHFKSRESILDRYLDVVILPQRYLTHRDAQELEDFFYRYHLIQIQALRLTAECRLRFSNAGSNMSETLRRNTVADIVYRRNNSHFNRARIGTLPEILPDLLPEGIVLDTQTETLWWNGTDFGAHPFANAHGLIQGHVIALNREVPFAGGARRFDLATLAQIEQLAALNALMPSARRNSAGRDRYPATLKPFLQEIGLEKVVEQIPDSGHLSFVWSSDRGVAIRRCYNNIPNNQHLRCTRWYDPHDALGHSAATAPGNHPVLRATSGNTWNAPVQCRPNQCTRFWNQQPRVVSLCATPTHQDPDNRCIADSVLSEWRGPGIYRAEQLKKDRFFELDLGRVL